MTKEKKGKGKKTDSTTRTPNICDNFSGDPGDPVRWQGVPASCTISHTTSGYPDLTFPFTPDQGSNGSYYISLPTLTTISIGSRLAAGTYYFNVSCSTGAAVHSVKRPLTPALNPADARFPVEGERPGHLKGEQHVNYQNPEHLQRFFRRPWRSRAVAGRPTNRLQDRGGRNLALQRRAPDQPTDPHDRHHCVRTRGRHLPFRRELLFHPLSNRLLA